MQPATYQINCNAPKLNLPEESVMFNANLPQSLGSPVVGQLETNGAFKLFILWEEQTGYFTFNTYIYRHFHIPNRSPKEGREGRGWWGREFQGCQIQV